MADSLTDGTAHCCQFEDSEVSSVLMHGARRRDPAPNVEARREGARNVGEEGLRNVEQRREGAGDVEERAGNVGGVAQPWSTMSGDARQESGLGTEGEEVYGHAGIIHAAQRLKWRLHDSGLLPVLLSDAAGKGHPQLTPRPRAPTAGFRLVTPLFLMSPLSIFCSRGTCPCGCDE